MTTPSSNADLIMALKLALPCIEYAEIVSAAEGQTTAHEKCLAALDHIRPLLAKADANPNNAEPIDKHLTQKPTTAKLWMDWCGVRDMREIAESENFKKLIGHPDFKSARGWSIHNDLLVVVGAESWWAWSEPGGPCMIAGSLFPTNEWWVISTALDSGWLLLQCRITNKIGYVENPSKEEWRSPYHAPSNPYRWLDHSRVEIYEKTKEPEDDV